MLLSLSKLIRRAVGGRSVAHTMVYALHYQNSMLGDKEMGGYAPFVAATISVPLMSQAHYRGTIPMKPTLLLSLGALCAPVFIIAFMIQGFAREQYSAHSISALSIGPHGWMQIANFIISGSLIVLLAIGLRLSLEPGSRGSVFGPIAIAIAGIGFIGAGIFVSDPVFGYPPNQPLAVKQFTTRGHLHDFFSMFWFIGVPTACFVLARRFFALGETAWAIYSILSAVGMLVFFVLAGVGFNQTKGFVDYAGLYQRLSAGTGVTWLMLLALHQIGVAEAG
jgi:Protein of unknown function (DUF998)